MCKTGVAAEKKKKIKEASWILKQELLGARDSKKKKASSIGLVYTLTNSAWIWRRSVVETVSLITERGQGEDEGAPSVDLPY